MSYKTDLQEDAKAQGLDFNSKTTVAELEELLGKTQTEEQVAATNTGEKDFVPNVQGYSYGVAPDNE